MSAKAEKIGVSLDRNEREVERYVAAYRAKPETSREIDEARKLARRAIAALPWDET